MTYDFVYGGNPPFPSLADAFYLGFYPACYLGIVLLVRRRISSFNASLWLDGFTAALAAGAVGASALLQVVVSSTDGSPIVVLTNLSYPLGDIILLALLVFVFAVTDWRPGRAWLLIGAALLLNTIGDGVYLYLSAQGRYVEGGVLDALWPASLILIALAAWHAPARRPIRRARAADTLRHTGRVRADRVRACSWTPRSRRPPSGDLPGRRHDRRSCSRAPRLTFGENTRLLDLSRIESLTDSLTGIGNRRKLVADLDAHLAARDSDQSHLLVVFDLNGFKGYNDTLRPSCRGRIARTPGREAEGRGRTAWARVPNGWRRVLRPDHARRRRRCTTPRRHSTKRARASSISSAFGAVMLPEEASNPSAALGVADQRLYAHKEQMSAVADEPARAAAPHARRTGARAARARRRRGEARRRSGARARPRAATK